jgi:hypothetical protein
MSKLAALLVRLQEKADARRRAEEGSSSSSASTTTSVDHSDEEVDRADEEVEGSGGDASVYGSRAYWDARYETGVVGATSGKGELSNEWCAPKPQALPLSSRAFATLQVARGWARPPCRHFKIQSCYCRGSDFVTAFQTLNPVPLSSERPSTHWWLELVLVPALVSDMVLAH